MDFDDIVKIVDQVKVLEARLAAVEAERDAAQAGEARAVEALKNLQQQAADTQLIARRGDGKTLCGTKECIDALGEGDCIEDWGHVEGCPFNEIGRDALDWLAQQRGEAAAEALEKLATDLGKVPWGSALHDVDWLRGILRTRAAEIRAGEVGNE